MVLSSSEPSLSLNCESLLRRITYRIRLSLELPDILDATTAEVRLFLETDRVMIYKFHPDGSGQVISESLDAAHLPSLMGLNFPADDIPLEARRLFVEARMRSVVDVEAQQIGQSLLRNSETGELLETECLYRPLDPCHAEYLTAMGVKSSLVIPILYQDQLWGLLVSHHAAAASIPEDTLRGMQLVVDQLTVAIAQSMLFTQSQEKAIREATVNRITSLLHSMPTIEFQAALEETVQALQGSGGRLFIFTDTFCCPIPARAGKLPPSYQMYTCGVQPVIPQVMKSLEMEQFSLWQEVFRSSEESWLWAVSDLYQESALRNLQPAFQSTSVRSLLVMSLWVRGQLVGYLSVFRDEIDTEKLWAGQFDPDKRQLYPRQSFKLWRESKSGQAHPWATAELELAQSLCRQFALAIEQYELYQQVQLLNVNLEQQVQDRTAELQSVTKQQQALFDVVTRILSSLDIETIFRTTTKSACQSLRADMVAVYRFNQTWGGEFVSDYEFVSETWNTLFKLGMPTVWNDTYLQETQGGRYRQGESFAVDDIYQAGHAPCHVEILEQFGIRAYAIAPIFVQQSLWGLLAAYQQTEPRHWDASSMQFLTQVATQLGIALQQAELLAQTQQQATQLQQTLDDLHKAQTQLIQTEKMSSLGQLVAGIAHEINNPVNFIYGNLSHVTDYTEDLLNLIQLYQRHVPYPAAEITAQEAEIDLDFLTQDLPKTLASMKMGADRIRQIVLSLRNFSRLDQAEMKAVNIHEGIDSTLLILQHRLKDKPESRGIQLIKEYGSLPLVECYAGQLNQVFMNLLGNAIDALEEWNKERTIQDIHANPATIHIQTSVFDNERVTIRIADNGIGIPEQVRQHLFDPFFTTKPVGKGTGLGLSISYQIVTEKHGGTLTCISAPGQGATFVIEIPIRQNEAVS
ncbi:MAG: hypothetical protein Kow00121_32530 [Elainellaceae cyanobacterium]